MRIRTALFATLALAATGYFLKPQILSLIESYSAPALPVNPAQRAVEQAIKSNNVLMIAKSYCPYCNGAKQLLSNMNVPYKAYDLDLMEPQGQGIGWQAFVAQSTGQRTVPMIWIKGKFIGGSSDLQSLQASGELSKLFK